MIEESSDNNHNLTPNQDKIKETSSIQVGKFIQLYQRILFNHLE
jgi:hypothetical protein